MVKVMEAKTPVERLDAHIAAMDGRLASLKEVKPALAALYGALSDEQKKKADRDPHRHGLHDVSDAGRRRNLGTSPLRRPSSPGGLQTWWLVVHFLRAVSLQPSASRRAQLVEDRAVRPIVTLARLDQAGEHLDDGAVRLHAGHDRLLVTLGQGANLAARTLLVAPELQQLVDLLDRKAEGAGALDEAQLVDVALVKDSVAIGVASSRAQQTEPLRSTGSAWRKRPTASPPRQCA